MKPSLGEQVNLPYSPKVESGYDSSSTTSDLLNEVRERLNSKGFQNLETISEDMSISSLAADIRTLDSKKESLNSENLFSFISVPGKDESNPDITSTNFHYEYASESATSSHNIDKLVSNGTMSAFSSVSEGKNNLNKISNCQCFLTAEKNVMKINGMLLKSQADYLKNLLVPLLDKDIERSTLVFLYNSHLDSVCQQIHFLQESIREYMKIANHNIDLALSATNLISDAHSWSSKVRNLYMSRGMFKKSQSSTLYSDLPKFSSNSSIDVYDFFKRFEKLTINYDYVEEKAELLYSKYLSSVLQDEVERYRDDYEATKQYLIHKYGEPESILTNLLTPLRNLPLPNKTSNLEESILYFRKLQAVIVRINSFISPKSLHLEEFELYTHSQDFLKQLLQLTPEETKFEFFEKWNNENFNSFRIKGKEAYQLLSKAIFKHYDKVCCLYSIGKDTRNFTSSIYQEPKLVLPSNNFRKTTSTIKLSKSSDCKNRKNKQVKLKPEYVVSDIEYPCVLPGHHHSIAECKEILKRSVSDRVHARKKSKFKQCAVCLQSSIHCTGGKCSNLKFMPQVLTCKDCKILHDFEVNRPCYSVLFCATKSHYKPPDSVISDALKRYIPSDNNHI